MAVDIIARALGGNALGQTSKVDEKIIAKLEELGFVTLLYTDDEHVATDENGNPIAYDIAAFVRIDEKGQPNGVATLDADGKVPEEQLPSGGGMSAETYDPDGSVADAGGIQAYMDAEIAAAIGNVDTLLGSGVIT